MSTDERGTSQDGKMNGSTAGFTRARKSSCLRPFHAPTVGSLVSGQPSVKVEVGGTDTEYVSSCFFLAKTTATRGKSNNTWECMRNFVGKFSGEHRIPTLLSRISVNCFDILGSMSGRAGSHHLFRKSGITELINLQREGSKAKVYQVRQVRAVLLKYRLVGKGDED